MIAEIAGSLGAVAAIHGQAAEIMVARAQFLKCRPAVAMLDAIPESALVLNAAGRIVAANSRFLSSLAVGVATPVLGRRPGEVLGCLRSITNEGGCQTDGACPFCGDESAVMVCLDTKKPCEQKCQILTSNASHPVLDLHIVTAHLPVESVDLILLVLRDVSAKNRMQVLERVFLHDLMNSIGSIYALAELNNESDFARDVHHLAALVLDEIRSHHKLMQAEAGGLEPDLTMVDVRALVDDVTALYSRHDVGQGKDIEVEYGNGTTLRTDPVLLRRVLGNILKNALEATQPGGSVTVSVNDDRENVAFAIHNDGAMSEEAQQRVFHLSFSTKANRGRGLGTYSARLFCEGPLRGKVRFSSSQEQGTTFTVSVPSAKRLLPARAQISVPAHGK